MCYMSRFAVFVMGIRTCCTCTSEEVCVRFVQGKCVFHVLKEMWPMLHVYLGKSMGELTGATCVVEEICVQYDYVCSKEICVHVYVRGEMVCAT